MMKNLVQRRELLNFTIVQIYAIKPLFPQPNPHSLDVCVVENKSLFFLSTQAHFIFLVSEHPIILLSPEYKTHYYNSTLQKGERQRGWKSDLLLRFIWITFLLLLLWFGFLGGCGYGGHGLGAWSLQNRSHLQRQNTQRDRSNVKCYCAIHFYNSLKLRCSFSNSHQGYILPVHNQFKVNFTKH